MSTNRREFIKTALAGATALTAPLLFPGCMREDEVLTVLHTNDVHSHIEPFPPDHPYLANMGGFARRVTLIEKIREENRNLLLLDAGDIFQGTPYFNFFGGKPELELMSKMKYDAGTIGNHEFDNGSEHLEKQLKHARFPFVCSNYVFKNTPLESRTLPWLVLKKGVFRVGILGLGIDPKGLIAPTNYGEMQWHDPVKTANATAQMLRNDQKCTLIIALSHLGLKYSNPNRASDMQIAQQTSGIDLIIGGHTHTFLDRPLSVKNKKGHPVLINQMGWGGVRLGRMDITLKQGELAFNNRHYNLHPPAPIAS